MSVIKVKGKTVKTIAEGCALFDRKPDMRGCMPRPGITLYGNVTLWFPQIQNNYWENDPTKDCIYETPKDPTKNEWQISRYIDKGEIRITFLKHYNSGYVFQGIFKLDREETRRLNKCVWKKISDKCETELEALKEHINEITKNK